jgi:hypothetical protein
VGDAGTRETLLPEVDSGTCAGPCVDEVQASCPYADVPCVASVDGGVSIACYSNGVKVITSQTSGAAVTTTVAVNKSDGTPCYELDSSSLEAVYIDYSHGNDVTTIAFNYDAVGDNRVTCVGRSAYQYDPNSSACQSYNAAVMTACTPGACTWP